MRINEVSLSLFEKAVRETKEKKDTKRGILLLRTLRSEYRKNYGEEGSYPPFNKDQERLGFMIEELENFTGMRA